MLIEWDKCIDLNILHKDYPNPLLELDPGQQEARKVEKSPKRDEVPSPVTLDKTEDVNTILSPHHLSSPLKIELREGAIPTCVSTTSRKVGLAIAHCPKAELDDMEVKDLLEKLPPEPPPTEWCHPFCTREKTRTQYEWVKRPTHTP